jgi:beta-lactamase regulating signal transducer with metallopeptidase domain
MTLPFFLEMAWKSSFIAGIALLLATFLKSRSPADRASVLQVGLTLLVLLPLVSLFVPAWQVELAATAEDVQPLVGTLLQVHEAVPAASAAAPTTAAPAAGTWDDPTLLIALLYLGGLVMAAGHLLGGLVTLRRWTSEAEPVSSPLWTQALERVAAAAGSAPVPLRVSADVPSPLSWGWMKPVILLDPDTYRRGEDADAILAHEMAHILRRDWPALMLSRIASALFWFNPLVWLVGRSFVRHAEEAADCRALAQVEPAHYAQALLGCATHSGRGSIPANSIAASDLAKRVHAILEGSSRAMPSGSKLCAVTILGCLALAGPVSAMKLIPAAAAQAAAGLAPISPAASAMVQRLVAPAPASPAPQQPVALVSDAPEAPAVVVAAASIKAAAVPASAVLAAPSTAPLAEVKAVPLQLASLAASLEAATPAEDERKEYESAMREARAASAEAARAGERAARAGQRAAEIGRRQARRSMAEGAVNMEKGAENMKHGARNMAEEAVKLRDANYREVQIARAAARGQRVTHQQLIDAIPQLEKGSRDMIKGAEDMRRGAEQMRRSAQD